MTLKNFSKKPRKSGQMAKSYFKSGQQILEKEEAKFLA